MPQASARMPLRLSTHWALQKGNTKSWLFTSLLLLCHLIFSQTQSICNWLCYVERSHDKVFSELIADLKDLEENGIALSDKSVIKGTLYCIAGDNLGSHCIGGFTENLASHSISVGNV